MTDRLDIAMLDRCLSPFYYVINTYGRSPQPRDRVSAKQGLPFGDRVRLAKRVHIGICINMFFVSSRYTEKPSAHL